jgi:hypothetical protein
VFFHVPVGLDVLMLFPVLLLKFGGLQQCEWRNYFSVQFACSKVLEDLGK